MPRTFELHLDSTLHASPERVWRWITSVEGIGAEMRPWLRMTTPPGYVLRPERVRPGEALFRSRVLLLGVVPVDSAEMTLVEIVPGRGFTERSPMRSMRLWEHRRWIEPSRDGATVRLHDRLRFAPRRLPGLTRCAIAAFFRHRHRVLRRRFADDAA